MAKRRQLRGFDLKQIVGFDTLIGVDEAGRGALAGPVVAGAAPPAAFASRARASVRLRSVAAAASSPAHEKSMGVP